MGPEAAKMAPGAAQEEPRGVQEEHWEGIGGAENRYWEVYGGHLGASGEHLDDIQGNKKQP